MPLINTSLPNLIQGVSQQPDAVRYDGQCEEQENALSSVVDGLQKRPAAEFIFDTSKGTSHLINSAVSKDCFFHIYKRTDAEKYCITQDNNVLRIHNADTAEQCTITEVGSTDFTITNNEVLTSGTYLASATPQQNFKPLTIGDSTFLLNTAIATTNSTATISSDVSDNTLVYIKQGDYGKKYGITISGSSVSTANQEHSIFSDPQPSAPSQTTEPYMADSTTILGQLATKLNNANNLGSGQANQTGNLLVVQAPSNSGYSVVGIDGLSGEGIGVVHREVSSLADLPNTAPHNYKVKVIGDVELGQDDFYCEFKLADNDTASNGTVGEGSWVECAGGLIPTDIDNSLMPRVLVSTAVNTFEIRRMSFNRLKAGDLDSNPYPSFLGNSINNIFQYKNRLGFLAQDAVILSEAGFGGYDATTNTQSYNFFRTSVTDLLDADPIDVNVASNDVTNLRSAQPFQENLILFSDNSQFVLKGGDLLTPKSISVTAVTNFDAVNTVDPIPLGSYLYFPFQRGKFSGLREFTVNATSDVYDSNEITAHVPQYIPNQLLSLTGSNAEQLIAMTSGTATSTPESTADTSIVFNNYGTNKFVSSTDLLLHVTAYNPNPLHVVTDVNAVHYTTNDSSNPYTFARANDVSSNQYNMRGVRTSNVSASTNAYKDVGASSALHRVDVTPTREDALTVSGLPASTNVNTFKTNTSESDSAIGAQYLEFSNFYESTKWSDYTSKWDKEEGYTVEWFGALDVYNNRNITGEGLYFWSFSTENARRLEPFGATTTSNNASHWTNVIESSFTTNQQRISVGFDNYAGTSTDLLRPSLITNFDGTITVRTQNVRQDNPSPHSGIDDFEFVKVVLTGNAFSRKVYINNVLAFEDVNTSGTFQTLYSLKDTLKEIKLSAQQEVVRPVYFRIYKGILSDAQRTFNYNNRFASA